VVAQVERTQLLNQLQETKLAHMQVFAERDALQASLAAQHVEQQQVGS
jgi:hypothetical protein